MRQAVTAVLATMLLLILVGPAMAQLDVTVREINAIPQSGIDALNAAGDALQSGDIDNVCGGLIYVGTLCRAEVRFTAVVMSDPLNSGLASLSNGVVGRVHIFVRDVAAETQGPEGMGIQVVDGSNSLGLEDVLVGDVITVVGTVSPFSSTMQISPTSIQVVGARDLNDPIMDPIVITTSDLNKSIGPDGAIQVNWDNLSKYRGNLVRIENATVLTRTLGDRVDWNWSSDGGLTSVAMYDTSIRYRNDKSDYPSNFNVRPDTYEPPPPGSTINIQGFITYNGGTSSDPFGLGVPNGEVLALNPMDDSDVEVTEAPINVTNIQRPATVPGSVPTPLSVDVLVDPSRQITSAKLFYKTSSDPIAKSKNPTGFSGNTYSFELPVLPDGDFGEFWFEASDNGGGHFVQENHNPFRVLYGGIADVEHIQRTADGKAGDSPFANWEVEMDLEVTVQLNPANGESWVQDDTAPWSGIYLYRNPLTGLNAGDVIRITHALIQESFGFTRLRDIVFETVSTGGTPVDYVSVTTNMLSDPDIAESFESMLVIVDDVVVTTTNSDDPIGPYGEFSVSSDGGNTAIRVDDLSDGLVYTDDNPGTVFSVYEKLDFVRGPLYYSFSNFKLVPESFDDIGPVINVASESSEVPSSFSLDQNYPNPFNPMTSIQYEIPVTGLATLNVYDSLGRLVHTLVSGEHTPGAYSVSFDGTEMASGLYLYRLTTGAGTISRTMVLLK